MEPSDTKARILRTAFQLFHEQGYHATGVATILREAEVNAGSLYHFFPSKDALLLGVLEYALGALEPFVMGPAEARTADPVDRVFGLLEQYRDGLAGMRCRMGCPIGNLALEVADDHPEARRLIDANFRNWIARVERWLIAAGDRLPRGVDRRQLAGFVLTVMEGGIMQARAAGEVTPFDASIAQLRAYFDSLAALAQVERRAAVNPHIDKPTSARRGRGMQAPGPTIGRADSVKPRKKARKPHGRARRAL